MFLAKAMLPHLPPVLADPALHWQLVLRRWHQLVSGALDWLIAYELWKIFTKAG